VQCGRWLIRLTLPDGEVEGELEGELELDGEKL
jgi:hypothetical protein